MNKKIKVLTLIMIFVFLCMSNTSFAEDSKFTIKIDPKLELLSIIQSLTRWPKFGAFTNLKHSYLNKINKYFGKYKDHPAVKWFDAHLFKGWSFDAPPKGMICLSELPVLTITHTVPDDILERAGGRESFQKMVDLLNKFIKDTKFMKFWAANQELYQKFYDKLKNLIPYDKYVKLMEKYYGEKSEKFVFVPVILFHGGGYGGRQITSEGKISYYFGGPHKVENDIPVFNEKKTRRLVFHEFGHSFVNNVVDQYKDEINKYSHFFKYIERNMSRQAYSSWLISMYEHFVRLGEYVLLDMAGFKDENISNYKSNLKRGFVFLPFLKDKVNEYLSDRKKYSSFRTFFPKFIDVFKNVTPVFDKKIPGGMGIRMNIDKTVCTILKVDKNSPFKNIDAQSDDIWHKIDNIIVNGETYSQVKDLWKRSKPGKIFKIILKRNGKEIKKKMKLNYIDKYKFVSK